jgi:hypothetical protein
LPAQFLHSQKLPYYPQLIQSDIKVLSPAQDDKSEKKKGAGNARTLLIEFLLPVPIISTSTCGLDNFFSFISPAYSSS